eukprot:9770228-Heterocapsa_arctica.AAC.1
MGGGEITHKDLNGDCRNDHCFTCAGKSPRSGFNQKGFPTQGSVILGLWMDMKAQGKYKDW